MVECKVVDINQEQFSFNVTIIIIITRGLLSVLDLNRVIIFFGNVIESWNLMRLTQLVILSFFHFLILLWVTGGIVLCYFLSKEVLLFPFELGIRGRLLVLVWQVHALATLRINLYLKVFSFMRNISSGKFICKNRYCSCLCNYNLNWK